MWIKPDYVNAKIGKLYTQNKDPFQYFEYLDTDYGGEWLSLVNKIKVKSLYLMSFHALM